MIQDFSIVFVDKQAVRARAVPIRGQAVARKLIWAVLAGVLLLGMGAFLTFGLLVRSGLKELAAQNSVRVEMIREQKGLLTQRNDLLDQDTLTRSAGKLGLFLPESRQLRRL